MKTPHLVFCLAVALTPLAIQAQQAAPNSGPTAETQKCLACHGPFDAMAKKNFKVEADPNPVNPHQYVPHGGGASGKFYDCMDCHTGHPFPPPKGFKDKKASMEPCFGCHHDERIENCANCHDKNRKNKKK